MQMFLRGDCKNTYIFVGNSSVCLLLPSATVSNALFLSHSFLSLLVFTFSYFLLLSLTYTHAVHHNAFRSCLSRAGDVRVIWWRGWKRRGRKKRKEEEQEEEEGQLILGVTATGVRFLHTSCWKLPLHAWEHVCMQTHTLEAMLSVFCQPLLLPLYWGDCVLCWGRWGVS